MTVFPTCLRPLGDAKRPTRVSGHAMGFAVLALWAGLATGQPRAPASTAAVTAGSAPAQTLGTTGSSRCADDEPIEQGGQSLRNVDADAPRNELKALVRAALERSQAVGASRLLAEAAELDIDEARSAARPSASLNANLGGVVNQQDGFPNSRGGQARASVILSAPLLDGGRVAETTGWRQHLAEAARQSRLSAEEQVALQAVGLALDRNRYRLQVQVYRQYTRKMACLAEALEVIVSRDRGRQSELVQAQKTMAQAELARVQAQAALRQVEIRLRRFVGDGLPPADGLASIMLALPPLPEVLAAAEAAPELAQLRAQADAQDSFTRIVATQGRPQVNWVVSGSTAVGAGNPRNVSAGLSVSIPLLTPGLAPATEASRRRAEAARLQVAEMLEERRTRVTDVYDQATSAFDRARRVGEVLRDTDRVRNFTLQQWQQLGRRSLFDVMGAEGEHYNLRVAYINALTDGQQAAALLASLGGGLRRQVD